MINKYTLLKMKTILFIMLFGSFVLQGKSYATDPPCKRVVFLEQDGYLVIDAEDVEEINSYWKITNSFPEDALGSGHLEHIGPNSYGQVDPNRTLTYNIRITNPGTYKFQWRARNGKNAVKSDEENDSWLKIIADDFYASKAGSNYDIGNHFIKVWLQDLKAWSWNSMGEYHQGSTKVNSVAIYATFDNPGDYKIYISGRSHNHPLDRLALFKTDKKNIALDPETHPSRIINDCFMDRTEWEVLYTDSEKEAGNSSMAIDKDFDTYWETNHGMGPVASMPHELQIDMKQPNSISEVHYTARQDNTLGAIENYEVYISNDFKDWGTAVASGTFDWKGDVNKYYRKSQVIELNQPVTGRYLRIKALSEAQGSTVTAISELNVIGEKDESGIVLGINDYLKTNTLRIYPNPVRNVFTLEGATDITDIQIYNIIGERVSPSLWNKQASKINVANLETGIYVIQLNINGAVQRLKFIKE